MDADNELLKRIEDSIGKLTSVSYTLEIMGRGCKNNRSRADIECIFAIYRNANEIYALSRYYNETHSGNAPNATLLAEAVTKEMIENAEAGFVDILSAYAGKLG
jgi:hypothetical protein